MRFLAALLTLALASSVSPAAPASPANPLEPLPGDARPISYRIDIAPDDAQQRFQGELTLTFEVLRATRQLALNADELDIRSASVDGVSARIQIDVPRKRVVFAFERELSVGRHELRASYTGRIAEQIEGLFRVAYPDRTGKSRTMLMTHLCCAVTGRLFAPLWDDPGVKATFELSIVVPGAADAVSNMPVTAREPLEGGRTRVRFQPTPKMSSYLLFVASGDFERLSDRWNGVDAGVVTQRGKSGQGRFALDATLDSLRYYTDYFGIPYALPKLDSISIPGTASFGAMENWGAMLFGEPYLLLDPAISTESDRQALYVIVAHEIAHQWFGNLVTMRWWDDLWLNESFATWISYKATQLHNPEWDMWLHAGESREVAMDLDARDITHPIVRKVTTVAEASEAFDSITYEKGQAVLRMLENYVGEDVFRQAVRSHIAAHTYGSAVTDELWSALDKAARQPVSAVARDFTMQAGVPLIDVESSICDSATNRTELRLTQRRFGLEAESKADRTWRVPVTATVVDSGKVSRQLVSGTTGARMHLDGCGPVKVNAGENGYYRVRYAPAVFGQLKSAFDRLPPEDQLGLLGDTYALAAAGYGRFDDYFALATQLSAASNPIVLSQFVRTARTLDRLYAGLPARAGFRRFLISRLSPLLSTLGWSRRAEERPNAAILRTELIDLLVEVEDPATRAEVARRYRVSERNADALSGDIRRSVVNAVGVDADRETLNELSARAERSTDSAERSLYLTATAQPRDPQVAEHALALAIGDGVPPQLLSTLIEAIAVRHPELTFDFITSRYAQLKPRLSAYQQLSLVPHIAAQSVDPAMGGKLEAFMRTQALDGAEPIVRRALSDIALSSAMRSKGLPQIDALVGKASPAGADTKQLPVERYQRAQQRLSPRVQELVLNAYVVPRWIGSSDEFWYDRETKNGHEFVVVNAASGARRAAFDHELVARSLSAATGRSYRASQLPFKEFTYDAERREIRFSVEGVGYAVPITGDGATDGELHAVARSVPAQAQIDGSRSPDGRWVVTTRRGNLWLHDLQSGGDRALTRDGEPDSGYGIWPDGYLTNYVPRAVKAGARLTEQGEAVGGSGMPVGLRWSPDSRHFFVPHFDQRHLQPYPMLNSAPPDGSLRPKLYQPRLALVGEKPARVEWYMADVVAGEVRKVNLPVERMLAMQADILPITAASWREDGQRLYAVAHGDNMESAFLFDIDANTGASRVVIEDRVLPRTDLNTTSYNLPNVWVSPDGRDAIWFSQRDGWGHLYLYDVRSAKLRNRITRGSWLVREIIRVDPAARVVYFTAAGREPGSNPYHRYLYRVGFDGSGLRLLTPEPADHVIMPPERLYYAPDGIDLHESISPSGRYVVYNYSTVSEPTKSAIRSTRDGRFIAKVDEADASALFASGWRAPEEFTALAADGKTKVYGVLYKPSDFDPSRRYPVLNAQYASPLIAVVPRNFQQGLMQDPGLDQAAYAELGFIVVTLDGRGTTDRSKDFSQVAYGHLDINGLDDHVAALRQLAAQRPYLDLDRVGVYGVSYGGYMTIRAMLTFPDFFKAGIATAGIAVMPGMFNDYHWSAFQGRPRYAAGGELRPDAASVPENWKSLDARNQVERLKGRLLIELSELDENALPGQTMTYIAALIAAGKPFEMLMLPGRDHFLLGEPYVVQRNWDFMVRHLIGIEPPNAFRLDVGSR